MLDHKDAIEENSEDSQEELDNIESISTTKETPFSCIVMIDKHIQDLLQDRQTASSEVKKDVDDAPSLSWLSLPIQIDLRTVFDEWDQSLVVTSKSECAEGLREASLCRFKCQHSVEEPKNDQGQPLSNQ